MQAEGGRKLRVCGHEGREVGGEGEARSCDVGVDLLDLVGGGGEFERLCWGFGGGGKLAGDWLVVLGEEVERWAHGGSHSEGLEGER